MKNFTVISVISLLLFCYSSYAQEVAPLKLGNYWIYDDNPYDEILGKTTVVDTNIIIDTITYNKLEYSSNYDTTRWYTYSRLREDGYYAIRLDTSYPAPNHEKIYWKKDAIVGDTWENYMPYFPLVYSVLETFIAPVFGSPRTVKYLEIDGSIVLFEEYWSEEFGKLSRSDFGGLQYVLKGCVIDGVAYGDTSFTIVSVKDEFETPNRIYLAQNYPNPFNPSTTINFTLSGGDFVVLEVFNVLGEKVKTLVNEFKPAGTHTIQFLADGLASGTYLYVLRTTKYTQAKKMQLVK